MELQGLESTMVRRGRPFHNLGQETDLPDGAPKDALLAVFAQRLYKAMNEKGWNQSDLARQADVELKKLDETKNFGRDLVSIYIRGRAAPGSLRLRALAAALDMQPADLLPKGARPSAGDRSPAMEMKSLGDGNAWVRLNKPLPMKTAIEIMRLADTDEDKK